jgi:AraC-like DNA-binding protein
MTARSETRRIREEREENAINRALSAALKIARYAESVKLYEFHLLEEFKQAEKDNPAAEPFERVRAVRGTEYILEAVTTDETRFLIELKRLGLIADIHTLHRNALNLRQLFELYDEKHSNLEQWIKSVPKTHSFLRNEFTVSGIPDDNLPAFNLHAAELNILVSQIIELIDTSLRIYDRAFRDYNGACLERFGNAYPQMASTPETIRSSFLDIQQACRAWGVNLTIQSATEPPPRTEPTS